MLVAVSLTRRKRKLGTDKCRDIDGNMEMTTGILKDDIAVQVWKGHTHTQRAYWWYDSFIEVFIYKCMGSTG